MWFAFGLISLIVFCIYFGKVRLIGNLKWEHATINIDSYEHSTTYYKGAITAMYFRCRMAKDVEFSVKPEKWYDKAFKWLGITVEYQVGRTNFDEKIYLISDNPHVCSYMSQSKSLQTLIESVVDHCENYGLKLKGLHVRFGYIWVHVVPDKKRKDISIFAMAKDFVPAMRNISKLFAEYSLARPGLLKDPFTTKAAVILALSSGLAFTGGLDLYRLSMINFPFTVDAGQLFSLSILSGSLIFGLMLTCTFILLGRTSRTHLVLIEIIFVGFFGAVSTSYAFLRDINIEFDNGMSHVFSVKVRSKEVVSGKSKSYYIEVEDWIDRHDIRRMRVSRWTYDAFNEGDLMYVEQMPDFLGIKWVSDIRRQ